MPSSKDVAKKAGVSQTTVSRVLNTPDKVSPHTRAKVEAAIAALNYIPDANARGLVRQKSQTLTLISGPLHNPFFVDSTAEIVNYATRAGYRINVHFVETDDAQAVYDAAFANKTDGIILSCTLLDDPVIARLREANIPHICFNRRHQSAGNYVEIDNHDAGRQALAHLVALGHRDIFWVGADPRVSTFANRFAGFREALDKAKSQYGNTLTSRIVNFKQLDRPDLHSLVERLARTGKLPQAFCAASDAMAIDIMDSLLRLGYRIPEDISIIGIDNVRQSASGLVQLTTVGCAKGQILGLTAIRALIGRIESETQENREDIRITEPVSLYLRHSTRQANST